MIYNHICNLRSHTYFQGSEGGVVNYGWPTYLSNTCLFASAGKLHDRTQLPTIFIYVIQHLLDWNRKGPHLSFRQMEHVRETWEREYWGKQQHLLSCICLSPTVCHRWRCMWKPAISILELESSPVSTTFSFPVPISSSLYCICQHPSPNTIVDEQKQNNYWFLFSECLRLQLVGTFAGGVFMWVG